MQKRSYGFPRQWFLNCCHSQAPTFNITSDRISNRDNSYSPSAIAWTLLVEIKAMKWYCVRQTWAVRSIFIYVHRWNLKMNILKVVTTSWKGANSLQFSPDTCLKFRSIQLVWRSGYDSHAFWYHCNITSITQNKEPASERPCSNRSFCIIKDPKKFVDSKRTQTVREAQTSAQGYLACNLISCAFLLCIHWFQILPQHPFLPQ